jgi:GTP-binding protein EngB required for normal cell division
MDSLLREYRSIIHQPNPRLTYFIMKSSRILYFPVRSGNQSRFKPRFPPKSPNDPWNPKQRRVNASPAIDNYRIRTTKTPFTYTTDFIESAYDLSAYDAKANSLFSLKTEYIPPVGFSYSLPKFLVPEFAFIGRSNVGKSSLISSLLSQNNLVRVSKDPGCTRSVNFYGFVNRQHEVSMREKYDESHPVVQGKHEFYLVDLPGYGFAKASKVDRESWQKSIDDYLVGRNMMTLRRAYLLIDSRHGIKDSDIKMMLRLDSAAVPYQVSLLPSSLLLDS